MTYRSPLANPLADEKLEKKVFKLIKKASKEKGFRRGVKEVIKAVRKGERGVVILAGDVEPLDVMSHVPVLLEDAEVPYVYVKSKLELGKSTQSHRSVSCVMVTPKEGAEYMEYYDKIAPSVKECKPTL